MNEGTVYLVYTTKSVGGAEKRLTGSWLLLKEQGHSLKMICSKELYEALCQQSEFSVLTKYEKDIILLPFTRNVMKDESLLKDFINTSVNAGDKLHFVGYYPLLLKKKKGVEYLYSFTSCSFNIVNIKGKISFAGAFVRADKVDILDPTIYNRTKKILFYKKDRIFQTSNSYVDADKFSPEFPKKNWIIFLGRFVDCKQTTKYAECLPELHRRFLEKGINDHHFYILGYGPLEEEVRAVLERPEYKEIPFTFQKTNNPEDILRHSKVFLSLQTYNNYPSKSLLEGLAAGNIPVVTDVGTTEMIAPRSFSKYVNRDFSAEELFSKIYAICHLDENAFRKESAMARDFVLKNNTLQKMADYYLNFYR